jgi:hypothetical protein
VRYATLKADNRFWQLIKWVWATEAERRGHTVSCESQVLCAHARPHLAVSSGTNRNPQLREHPDCVGFTPVFDNLAISKAVDSDAGHDHWRTARPDSELRALVDSAPGYVCNDQITFDDLRLDRELEIGKGAADTLEMLFVPLNPRWLRGISTTQWPLAR